MERIIVYHVGSSFTVSSILQAGLIVVGKDSTEGWQTDNRRKVRWWFVEAKNRPLQQQMEDFSGRSPLCQFEKKHNRKDYSSGRHELLPLSFMIQCQLTAMKRW